LATRCAGCSESTGSCWRRGLAVPCELQPARVDLYTQFCRFDEPAEKQPRSSSSAAAARHPSAATRQVAQADRICVINARHPSGHLLWTFTITTNPHSRGG
jgi:hypothetical protein